MKDPIREAFSEVGRACEDAGDLVYDVRAMMQKYDLPKKDKALALLQYMVVYLRCEDVEEDEMFRLAAGAIARAFSVSLDDCQDVAEDIVMTPQYPAEPGECN